MYLLCGLRRESARLFGVWGGSVIHLAEMCYSKVMSCDAYCLSRALFCLLATTTFILFALLYTGQFVDMMGSLEMAIVIYGVNAAALAVVTVWYSIERARKLASQRDDKEK